MKTKMIFACLVLLAISGCSKSTEKNTGITNGNATAAHTIRNGVDVEAATAALNSYRLKGFLTMPAAGPLIWNDTLSDVAYLFAKQMASQGDGGDIYHTYNHIWMLDYPGNLGYHFGSLFGMCFQFPDTTDIKTMIDFAFTNYTEDELFTTLIMQSTTTEFGMGVFNNRWYLYGGY